MPFEFCPKDADFSLTPSWWRPFSYRNRSIDLLCKSMDWFLYDNGLRHERVKENKANWGLCLTRFLSISHTFFHKLAKTGSSIKRQQFFQGWSRCGWNWSEGLNLHLNIKIITSPIKKCTVTKTKRKDIIISEVPK